MQSKSTVTQLKEAIEMNREIEFIYDNKTYGIVNHQEGWCLVNEKENLSDYYEENTHLIENEEIEGYKIIELFYNSLVKIEGIF